MLVTGIHECLPASRIIAMLIDELPEEVTQFRRAAKYAEVIASTLGSIDMLMKRVPHYISKCSF